MEKEEESVKSVSVRTCDQLGNTTYFKLKCNTQLQKLMDAYVSKMGLGGTSSVRFMFDGQRIRGTDTPKSLGMEEDDTIDVLTEQTGGYLFHLIDA